MKAKEESYIFDSHSLLKYFQKETGFEKIIKLLVHIGKNKVLKYLNTINLGEIIYITKREFGDKKKLELLTYIERLDFTLLPITNNLVFQAAEHKADYSISYADCFVLASSIEHQSTIVTGDPGFKKVEHLAKIIWV